MMHILLAVAGEELYPFNDVLHELDRGRRATHRNNIKWPGCTVPYTILTTANCNAHLTHYPNACHAPFLTDATTTQSRIATAAAEINTKTAPLKCTFHPTPEGGKDVLYVESIVGTCHVNHVGYSTTYTNVMSLGWCATHLKSIKHELMHVLGLDHEHQSPASIPYLTRCAPNDCRPNQGNCLALNQQSTPFDLASIMMYPLDRDDGCSLQLTALGHLLSAAAQLSETAIGTAGTISDTDGAAIAAMYNISCADTDGPSCLDSTVCVPLDKIANGKCDPETNCLRHNFDGKDCLQSVSGTAAEVNKKKKSNFIGLMLAIIIIVLAITAAVFVGHSDPEKTPLLTNPNYTYKFHP